MSSPRIEASLARLYTDDGALAAFLRSPVETARAFGLDDGDAAALAAVDRDGMIMAAASYRAKRDRRKPRSRWLQAWHAIAGATRPWAPSPWRRIDEEAKHHEDTSERLPRK
jgi:hypothetical protein